MLPSASRAYRSFVEELVIGRGDYVLGGARSPPFLDLDNARHRRPVIFGEVFDTLDGYHESAASMFSGRQNDVEEWAVMWKELGADGVCLRLTRGDSPQLVRRIIDRTRLPVILSAETDILKETVSLIDDSVMIIQCKDREQSLEMAGCSGNHIVSARCDGTDPKELCQIMISKGARNVIVDLGYGSMDESLKELRSKMNDYRMSGLMGVPDGNHTIMCDVTPTWDIHGNDVSARRASMYEATVALSVMMSGADLLIMKGPGAADMARVYGEELADL